MAGTKSGQKVKDLQKQSVRDCSSDISENNLAVSLKDLRIFMNN